jgi:hypothetical protein
MLAAIAVQMRMQGRLTGSGPIDSKQAKEWRAQGNVPYAIKWEDADGKTHYFQLDRFDPIQFPFTLVAGAVDIYMGGHVGPEEQPDIATATVVAIAHQFRDKTYTKNIAGFLDALVDDNRAPAKARELSRNFIPFSTLLKGLNPDPYLREVHSYLDAIKATQGSPSRWLLVTTPSGRR